MDLAKSCEEGKIGIKYLCNLIFTTPVRTKFLKPGDYVIFPYFGRNDVLALERITEINSPEKGDFVTDNGSTGPISGNIFITAQGDLPKYILIEGDKVKESNCPAYDSVNEYLKRESGLN